MTGSGDGISPHANTHTHVAVNKERHGGGRSLLCDCAQCSAVSRTYAHTPVLLWYVGKRRKKCLKTLPKCRRSGGREAASASQRGVLGGRGDGGGLRVY